MKHPRKAMPTRVWFFRVVLAHNGQTQACTQSEQSWNRTTAQRALVARLNRDSEVVAVLHET